jgi:glutathione S-transferase
METPTLVLCDGAAPASAAHESYSPFVLKTHRALKLAGLEYETRRGRMPADFKEHNPIGQIPVLLEDGEAVADSTRILARLVELAPSLLPSDPRARAEAWLWEDWADRALRGYVVAARWADDRNWPAVRDALFGGAPWFVRRFVAPLVRRRVAAGLRVADFTRAGMRALWDDYRRILDALEARAPERGFWLGEAPSIADVGLFGHLHALRIDALTPWQARELKLRPALTDWLDRVDEATRARPSAIAIRHAA